MALVTSHQQPTALVVALDRPNCRPAPAPLPGDPRLTPDPRGGWHRCRPRHGSIGGFDADARPLICLARIQQLELLRHLFTTIWIAEVIAAEIGLNPVVAGTSEFHGNGFPGSQRHRLRPGANSFWPRRVGADRRPLRSGRSPSPGSYHPGKCRCSCAGQGARPCRVLSSVAQCPAGIGLLPQRPSGQSRSPAGGELLDP